MLLDPMGLFRKDLLPISIIYIMMYLLPAPVMSSPKDIDIKKISKIMNDEDPTGRNHNIKIIIESQSPIEEVAEWKLILGASDGTTKTLVLPSVDDQPFTGTELIFYGNLSDSKSVFLQALTNSQEVVAMDYIGLPIIDLQSYASWVGSRKDNLNSTLRLTVGKNLEEVVVNGRVCSHSDIPCYYMNINPKPTIIPRCISSSLGSDKLVELCDERESLYQEMPTPSLYLRNDGKLEITHDMNDFKLEVVAYDSENYNILSNTSHECYDPKKQIESEENMCLLQLSLPEGQKQFMVLVVEIDEEGYVHGSNLQVFRGNLPDSNKIGVLVGSFIGTMMAIAILILLGMFLMKRKRDNKRKRGETNHESLTGYSKAPTE